MNTDNIVPAQFKGEFSEKVTEGTVTIRHYDQQVRTKRAVKVAGILFGLAVFSIILPIAHFVLVPGFLLATPIGAIFAYGVEKRLVEAQAKCPECQTDFQIAVGKPSFPYRDVCASCHKVVIIETHS